MHRDHAKLHFIVLLWGFTGILGELIKLPSPVLVFWRVSLAAVLLVAIIGCKRIPGAGFDGGKLRLLANGLLLGIHWTLFFLSIHVSNVSVCMVGAATTALWTAFLEPLLVRSRKVRLYEFGLGAVMVAAIALIYSSDFDYDLGLMLAIASAGVGTTFSIFNSHFTKLYHHHVIAAYQMIGAAALCAVVTAVLWLSASAKPALLPAASDWGWLLLLATFCTVYAYSHYIELLKRLSVFTVHLAYNLEPVYGIILAAMIFKEHQMLGGMFYLGALIIVAVVFIHPFVERAHRRRTKA